MYSSTSGLMQPVVFLPGGRSYSYPDFSSSPHIGFSVTHIFLGCLCIVFNIVAIIVGADSGFVAIGIWGGLFMTITGSIGIVAVKEKGPCTVTSIMIMSTISSIVGAGVLITFSKGLSVDVNNNYWNPDYETRIAMDACLIVCGLTEGVIGIIQSALCCMVMGRENTQSNQIQNVMPNGQQNLVANQQLYMYVQGQMVPISHQAVNLTSTFGQPSVIRM